MLYQPDQTFVLQLEKHTAVDGVFLAKMGRRQPVVRGLEEKPETGLLAVCPFAQILQMVLVGTI
jgi:hypothetical protein